MQEDTSLACGKTHHYYAGRQGKTLIRLIVLTSYYLHLRISYNVDVSKTIISRVLMPQPFLQVAFEEIFGCSSTRHASFDSRPHHVFSMHWVCAPVCGSPKFTLWLTVRWLYPSSPAISGRVCWVELCFYPFTPPGQENRFWSRGRYRRRRTVLRFSDRSCTTNSTWTRKQIDPTGRKNLIMPLYSPGNQG